MSEDGGGQMMIMVVMMAAAACCCSSVGGLGYAYSQNWLCTCCDLCYVPETDTTPYGPPTNNDDTEDTENDDEKDDDEKDDGGTKNTSYDTIKSMIKGDQSVYMRPYKSSCDWVQGQCWYAWKLSGSFPNKVKFRIPGTATVGTDLQKTQLGALTRSGYTDLAYLITKPLSQIRETKGPVGAKLKDTSKYREWKISKAPNNTVYLRNKDNKYLIMGNGCTYANVRLSDKKTPSCRWVVSKTQGSGCT